MSSSDGRRSIKGGRKRSRTDEPLEKAKIQREESNESTTSATELPIGNCVNVSSRFRKVCRVGEGTYGVVYKAEDRQNPGDFVALKRCIPHHQATDGFPITALREIHSLRVLHQHPHVISLRTDISAVAVSKNDIFLVFEYCEHDLAQLLDHQYQKQRNPASGFYATKTKNPRSPFQECHVKTLMQQLLSALECMHENRLIHRDIKVSNLLYSGTGNLKLADFGLSRELPASSAECGGYHLTPNVVSLWYRPPELLLGSKTYDQSIDVWGVGCVFAELLRGYPLWSCKTEADQIHTIFQSLGTPTLQSWPQFHDMPLIQNGTISIEGYTRTKASTMPLLDSFSFLSTSGLLLLAHLLHYDRKQRLTATQALQQYSNYWNSDPLPTPPENMPKFKSLHTNNNHSK